MTDTRRSEDRASIDVDDLAASSLDDVGASLDLDDAIALCSGRTTWSTHGIPALGLGPIVLTDGPHGVRRTTTDAAIIEATPSTCFPTAVGLAASWDPELLAEVGEAIGREARALGVSAVLGPGANIKRHPLGGRNFEYFSEDPLLGGELAAGMIRGIQTVGVAACLKHFVANNQETRRMTVDVVVDERALREIYLAGFERAITSAQPSLVMSAYNRLNGTYCSDDRWLLTEVLRDDWGFGGAVVTDWGAANDRVAGIRAGLDLEMPGSGGVNDRSIRRALASGELDRADFDRVVERLVALIRRGNDAVDRRAVDQHGPLPVEIADAHHEIARRAAAEASVLLTNDGVLPLEPTGTIAVIGGFATDPRIQGAGSSQVAPTRVDTLLDAVRSRLDTPTHVSYAAGYDPHAEGEREDLLDEAVLVARAADVAIVMVGLPDTYESEGFDRDHLRLPDHHNHLVRAVTEVNPNTVVVLANGAPVQLPWIDRPRAVLEAYLGGQGAGEGIARLLFGEVEPGGRLAETFPLRQHDHGSDPWFPGIGRQVQYRESIHVGYRWFDTTDTPVLFPFGHGLGYTTFEYGGAVVAADRFDADAEDSVTVRVDLINTGTRHGSEVVQVYLRRPASTIVRSHQELVGFRKVRLDPGERSQVEIRLDRRSFAHWDVTSGTWQVEPGPVELCIGSSSRDLHTSVHLEVASGWVPTESSVGVAPRSAADLADDARFRSLLGRAIPRPDPVEPFHRNSTFEDVSSTGLGRGLRAGAIRTVQRQFGGADAIDEVTAHLLERAMSEAPLRAMVLFGRGRLSWAALDRMIATMNAARRVRGLRRRRRRSD